MRYISEYSLFESNNISKPYLIDKIKYYSNWLHRYMLDVNKYTNDNLNLSFSYDTHLTIREIFENVEKLHRDSPNGLITAISNEFNKWSRFFTRRSSEYDEEIRTGNLHRILPDPLFIYDYELLDDDYKTNNHRTLYNQKLRESLYLYIGERIKQLISGTIWDIPSPKLFTDEDMEFIFDQLISNSDYYTDIDQLKKNSNNGGGIIISLLPSITTSNYESEVGSLMYYDSDFMYSMESYFGGVLTISSWRRGYYSLYLPFYKILKN